MIVLPKRRTERSTPGVPRRRLARSLCGLLCVIALGCDDDRLSDAMGAAPQSTQDQAPPDPCAQIAAGCSCEGNEFAQPCTPDDAALALLQQAATGLCYEGTRYCRDGIWSACEDVEGYAYQSRTSHNAIVDPDPMVPHPNCSACDPTCFEIIDPLDPSDPLDPMFSSNVEYDPMGGLVIDDATMALPPPPTLADIGVIDADAMLPEAQLATITPGSTGSLVDVWNYWPATADIYFLVDGTGADSTGLQALADNFIGPIAPTILDATVPCAATGMPGEQANGITGAARCMFTDAAFGVGMFRDLPFAPHAGPGGTEQSEIAYQNAQDISVTSADCLAALGSFGGVQDAGDAAASQIQALHAVATGTGWTTGPGYHSVPDASCGAGFGYPCFRAGGNPIVILVTDNPGHNGNPAFTYDYPMLSILSGGGSTYVVPAGPPTADDVANAFHLTDNAEGPYDVYTGSTAGLSSVFPASSLVDGVSGCMPDGSSADAIFTFDVVAPGPVGSTIPIDFSAAGTEFSSSLSVHSGPPAMPPVDSGTASGHERFASIPGNAQIGTVAAAGNVIDGDTTAMLGDYQQSLIGGGCGTDTMAPDAVYSFTSDGSGTDLDVSLTMGAAGSVDSMFAVYDASQHIPDPWPGAGVAVTAVDNTNTQGAPTYTIPFSAGTPYVTVRGDLSAAGMSADYDLTALTAPAPAPSCTANVGTNDAIFRLVIDQDTNLAIDAEGPAGDAPIAISLHDGPPLPVNAGMPVTHTAADTHNDGNDGNNPWDGGTIDGLHQIWQGDTSNLPSSISDSYCGTRPGCKAAVYRVHVEEGSQVDISAVSPSGTWNPTVTITRAAPQTPTGDYPSIAAGVEHTCALSQGDIYCWGSDSDGQLGDGPGVGAGCSGSDCYRPQRVQGGGGFQGKQVAAGRTHTCAATTDNLAYCWGSGSNGKLGDGTGGDMDAPVQVAGLTGVVQVAVGHEHSCALLDDFSVWCWGADGGGQLGNGAAGASSTPVLVQGGVNFAAIAANANQSCGIRAGDRAVFCWGDNTATASSNTPVRVGSLTDADHVMVGYYHACAVMLDGEINCWGDNSRDQLGQGSSSPGSSAAPLRVVQPLGGPGSATDPFAYASRGWAAGEAHSCVTTRHGFVSCWGDRGNGRRGDGPPADPMAIAPSHTPGFVDGATLPLGGIVRALEVSGSSNHTCAYEDGGVVSCWGDGAHYKLGLGINQLTFGGGNPYTETALAMNVVQDANFGNQQLDQAVTIACSGDVPPDRGCVRNEDPATDKHYWMCEQNDKTFSEAGLACLEAGGELALPQTPNEARFIGMNISEPSWIGIRRSLDPDGDPGADPPVDPYTTLTSGVDFETVGFPADPVWRTDHWYKDSGCCFKPSNNNAGNFIPTSSGGATDLLPASVQDWSPSSQWVSRKEPRDERNYNCVTAVPNSGKWTTDECGSVPPPPSCSLLGCLFALLGAILVALLSSLPILGAIVGGLFGVLSWSFGGAFVLPYYNGGVDRAFVCEAPAVADTISTLGPGDYYVTVSSPDDGASCQDGDYALTVQSFAGSAGLITCDDSTDGVTSLNTPTLSPGTYYLLAKGSTGNGTYNLTLRDRDIVPPAAPVACGSSGGAGVAAAATFTPSPNTTYNVLVKGQASNDSGAHTLSVGPAGAGAPALMCDDEDLVDGDPAFTVDLQTGSYYAVLKGLAPLEGGNYTLTIGGTSGALTPFIPYSYADTLTELDGNGIKVATVLWCDPSTDCTNAEAQWRQLASDTGGAFALAAGAADIPNQVVAVLNAMADFDTVTATLVDVDPGGFTNVTVDTPADPGNHCTDVPDMMPLTRTAVWANCVPGSAPSFRVSLTNPAAMPVAESPAGPAGAYKYILQVVGVRGSEMETRNIPIFVYPIGVAPPSSFGNGTYHQDLDSRGCDDLMEVGDSPFRPSWDSLEADVAVLPDTSIDFFVCAADSMADLDDCATAGSTSTGYLRVMTVTAGSGGGDACAVDTDCLGGYCSPTLGICQYLEGTDCVDDTECLGMVMGSCTSGPSAGTIGDTCPIANRVARPDSILGDGNFKPFLRMKADLNSGGTMTTTPSLYRWNAKYRCRQTE